MDQIHAHEVMEMMATSGKIYTRETLVGELIGKFGREARFCTCSTANLDAGQMVEFLDARGKLVHRAGGFQILNDAACQH